MGMTGAPLLAGRAALLSGAGKVHLGFVADQPPAVDLAQPELMLRGADDVLRGADEVLLVGDKVSRGADNVLRDNDKMLRGTDRILRDTDRILSGAGVLLVGPGLGQSRLAGDHLARALHKPVPLVLDADALNLLALDSALAQRLKGREHPTVLTPHPAEAARLLQTGTATIQADRVGAALKIAERFHSAVALKGAGTVCAFVNGEWSINGSGNPGLASAGSGDVLAGVVGALLAQGYAVQRALMLAVCVHGAAADRLVADGVGPIGLTASELPAAIRLLLNDE